VPRRVCRGRALARLLCTFKEKNAGRQTGHYKGKRQENGLEPGQKGKRARVLSGMRPTGRMHIGNYFGALANWVRLQNEVQPDVAPGFSPASPSSPNSPLATGHSPLPAYDCFYFIADWHSLTSDYADTSGITQNVIDIATDYLAGGLDPTKSVIFLQSLVPEHAELHLLLSMVTPLGWLERVPTYKEALENIKDKDLHNYGFLGYPVLQCGDIVMYGEPGAPLVVPVGEDQVSHVEVSREIVRRFNTYYEVVPNEGMFEQQNQFLLQRLLAFAYVDKELMEISYPVSSELRTQIMSALRRSIIEEGWDNFAERIGGFADVLGLLRIDKVLCEPEAMLTKTPRIPGTDGRKMSKSYGNAITLSESDADIRAKTKVMMTDPRRKRRSDPGEPDDCPAYDWHKLFSPPETLQWAAEGCRTAGIGCIECKAKMADHMIEWITPIRERRVQYEKNPARVLEVLDEGSKKARAVAQGTMERVREAVFGWGKKRKEIEGAAGTAKA
jgi:tryptophanyl-tRNA synthetase